QQARMVPERLLARDILATHLYSTELARVIEKVKRDVVPAALDLDPRLERDFGGQRGRRGRGDRRHAQTERADGPLALRLDHLPRRVSPAANVFERLGGHGYG